MELYVGFVLVLVTTFLFGYLLRDRMSYWKKRGIPHDDPELLYGNFKGVPGKRHLYEPIRGLYEKYKGTAPFCGLYYFNRPAAMILDFKLVKRILIKDFSNFMDKGLYHNEKDDPLSGHLFALDGIRWRQLRCKLSSTFTSGKMKIMFPTVKEVGQRLEQVLAEQVNLDSVIDIKELLACFTTDVIGTCAFGIDCNSLKDPNAEFRLMGKKIMTDRRHHSIVLNFIRSYPNAAMKLGLRIVPDHIHKFFMRAVCDTVKYREKNNVVRNDFMNIMIKMKNNDCEYDKKVTSLTMNELAAQAFVFYVGGFETSSSTMSFALFELAQNQGVQDKLRAEIREVLAQHGKLTYETIKKMKYMDQVISETLRKYTILIVICRQAIEDYRVPETNYKIEKGTLVVIPSDAIHHDPEIYPNPEKFDPERFSQEVAQSRDPLAFLPFGQGPRNCIGYRFGKMQMQIALTLLVNNFRFQICEKTEVPISIFVSGQILSSKNGIYLKVKKLSK